MNGKQSGYGRWISNDSYYVGDYKDDKRHGQGTYVHRNGTTYVGAWKDSLFHGLGKYTNKQGIV